MQRSTKRLAELGAALSLLLAKNQSLASKVGFSLWAAAEAIRIVTRDTLLAKRAEAKNEGARLLLERISEAAPLLLLSNRDLLRSDYASRNYARDWLKQATLLGSGKKANLAMVVRSQTIAITENAEAFNYGRELAALRLPAYYSKQWDALLDACPVCSAADGTVVSVHDSFPLGTPGAVHPRCQCTFHVITSYEKQAA